MAESSASFLFDGEAVDYLQGQSVAAALIASGKQITRLTRSGSFPRGLFCGIGACFDCLVVIDGNPNQRACATEARPHMKVETQQGAGS